MDLMAQLPWQVYHDQAQVADFQRAWGKELDVLLAARDDYYQQMRPGTATWGLALFEREYGIVPKLSQPLEKRREVWRAKRRGRGTTTTAVLKETTQRITGLPAQVVEHPEEDYFEIWVHSGGKAMDLGELVPIIEEIKPAHLGMVFGWRVQTDLTLYAALMGGSQPQRSHSLSPPEHQKTTEDLGVFPAAYRGGQAQISLSPPKTIRVEHPLFVGASWRSYSTHQGKGVGNYG